MPSPELTPEQHEHLNRHIAAIGHNHGPALVERREEILERAGRHHRLRTELIGIRAMFDMLHSDIAGEYVLPATTAGYVAAGLGLVALITGVSIVTQPVGTILLDGVVVSFIIASLHGEIEQYVDWRVARDPSYAAVKHELSGRRST
jgi:hypothetical protein